MPSYGAAAGPSAAAATPPPTAAAPAQRRAHHALLAALVGGLAVAGWVSSSRGLAATLSVKPGADVTPESLAALAQSGCQHLAVSYGAPHISSVEPCAARSCPPRSASPISLSLPPFVAQGSTRARC